MSSNEQREQKDMSFTARYYVTNIDGGYRFQFRCALCDGGYATKLIKADTVEKALPIAEKEARLFFNGCSQCDKWVCDYHYNMQEALCTECIPLEENSEQLVYLRDKDANCIGVIRDRRKTKR